MVAETIKGNFLFCHQLAGPLVHLGVVDPDAAEDCKSLEENNVRFTKRGTVFLQKKEKKL